MRNENGSMCEMNDFHFRVVLTRTHAGFWFILPFFSILLHAGKRDDVTPTGRAMFASPMASILSSSENNNIRLYANGAGG